MNMVERLNAKWDEHVLRGRKTAPFPFTISSRWWINAIADELETQRNCLHTKADATEIYPVNAMLSTKGNEMNTAATWLREQAKEEEKET